MPFTFNPKRKPKQKENEKNIEAKEQDKAAGGCYLHQEKHKKMNRWLWPTQSHL